MAVNPFTNPEIVSVNHDLIDQFERHVDKHLCDGEWLKSWRCGPPEAPYYNVIFTRRDLPEEDREKPGVLKFNANEIKIIEDRYRDAGWDRVQVQNSDQNGEPAGIVSIKLTSYLPPSLVSILIGQIDQAISQQAEGADKTAGTFELNVQKPPSGDCTLSDRDRFNLTDYYFNRGWRTMEIQNDDATIHIQLAK